MPNICGLEPTNDAFLNSIRQAGRQQGILDAKSDVDLEMNHVYNGKTVNRERQ